jgi:hypothetical protein
VLRYCASSSFANSYVNYPKIGTWKANQIKIISKEVQS